jgi:hypothetical protein
MHPAVLTVLDHVAAGDLPNSITKIMFRFIEQQHARDVWSVRLECSSGAS